MTPQLKSLVLLLGLQSLSQALPHAQVAPLPEYKFEGFPPLPALTTTSHSQGTTSVACSLNNAGEPVAVNGYPAVAGSPQPHATETNKHLSNGAAPVRPAANWAGYPVSSRLDAYGPPPPRVKQVWAAPPIETGSIAVHPSGSTPPLAGDYDFSLDGLAIDSAEQTDRIPSQITDTAALVSPHAVLEPFNETTSDAVHPSTSASPPAADYEFSLECLSINAAEQTNLIPSQNTDTSVNETNSSVVHSSSSTPPLATDYEFSLEDLTINAAEQTNLIPSQNTDTFVSVSSSPAALKSFNETNSSAVDSSSSTSPLATDYEFSLEDLTINAAEQTNPIPSQTTDTFPALSFPAALNSSNETGSNVDSSSSTPSVEEDYEFSLEDLTINATEQTNLIPSQTADTFPALSFPAALKSSNETSSNVDSSSSTPSVEEDYEFSIEDLAINVAEQTNLIPSHTTDTFPPFSPQAASKLFNETNPNVHSLSSTPSLEEAYELLLEGLTINPAEQTNPIPSQPTDTFVSVSSPQAALKSSNETNSNVDSSTSSPSLEDYEFSLEGLAIDAAEQTDPIPSQTTDTSVLVSSALTSSNETNSNVDSSSSTPPLEDYEFSLEGLATNEAEQTNLIPSQNTDTSVLVPSALKPSNETNSNAHTSSSTPPLEGLATDSSAETIPVPSKSTQTARWITKTSVVPYQATASPSSGATCASGNTYTVVSGDNCQGIAAREGVSTTQLITLNHLPTICNTLFIGQILCLPEKCTSYTVQRGDFCSKIAHQFGVELSALYAANPCEHLHPRTLNGIESRAGFSIWVRRKEKRSEPWIRSW